MVPARHRECSPPGSGLEVFQLREQAGVRRVPAEGVAGAGTGRRLVHREDRAERAEALRRYRLDWQAQAAADDRGDIQDRVALVGDGLPGRPGGQKATVTTAQGWRSALAALDELRTATASLG
jgi:hypothetical protein